MLVLVVVSAKQNADAQVLKSMVFTSDFGDFELTAKLDLPNSGGEITLLAEDFYAELKQPAVGTSYIFHQNETINDTTFFYFGTLTLLNKNDNCVSRGFGPAVIYDNDDTQVCADVTIYAKKGDIAWWGLETKTSISSPSSYRPNYLRRSRGHRW